MDLPVSNALTPCQGNAGVSVAWGQQGQAKVKRAQRPLSLQLPERVAVGRGWLPGESGPREKVAAGQGWSHPLCATWCADAFAPPPAAPPQLAHSPVGTFL